MVTKDVPDYALVMGNPARQKGWMSRHGHILKNPDQDGIMVCPESGFRYQLTINNQQPTTNNLHCLDLDEDNPLPSELSRGTTSYRQFKSPTHSSRHTNLTIPPLTTMKLLTIVGARPQFIKAAMVSRAIIEHNRLGKSPRIVEEIIHTGQHYDPNMSEIFFQQMQIPEPVVNLQAGTGMHGEMTGRMLAQIEKEIVARKPDWVLVYGDTNSTLAGALAAAKLHVPVAHVEAGLRSFNKRMPEEINRILTDHVSTLAFLSDSCGGEELGQRGHHSRRVSCR